MPKIILTEAQAEKHRLQANLRLIQGQRKNADMAKIINTSEGTFYNRKRDPESLTLREVRALCKYFKIDRGRFVKELLEIN